MRPTEPTCKSQIDWNAWLKRDGWTLFEAICLLLDADPEQQTETGLTDMIRSDVDIIRSDNVQVFAGGVTWADVQYDGSLRALRPRIAYTAPFQGIDSRARESYTVGKLKIHGDHDDWYENFVVPREWLEWADGKFKLPQALESHLHPQVTSVASQKDDLQQLANEEAKKYKNNHGRWPKKKQVARELEKKGLGSAATIERQIHKKWPFA